MDLTVVCLKWGDRYGPEYVNILKAMVERNLHIPHRFLCVTDDPEGVEAETVPLEDDLPIWWGKVGFFKKRPYGITGRILYLDLDVVIVDSIDEIACFNSRFGIIDDWNLPGYNSSVFVLDSGSQKRVWTKFSRDVMDKYPGDQDWITQKGNADTFPEGWCTSFRKHGLDKPRGKVVCFHGLPKPKECGGWVSRYWHG